MATVPKIVDREQRRREIAEAVLRLIAREGIEAVSVRTVATEAGLSAGAVQKYFATRDELFRFAFDLTGEYIEQRWMRVPQGHLLTMLRALVAEALPLDDQRRAEVIVVLAFAARAAVLPEWADHLREGYEFMRAQTADFLGQAQRHGHVRDDLDAGKLADVVVALTDGFAQHLLQAPPGSELHRRLLGSLEFALTELLAPRAAE
ncbi:MULTISPECIES: TetR/AcrR family transcriptional regulator [Amycolatopsis]|uniref:TetR/AcrR family transcriptional regulator n=1 Tax=Amycolatopsis TaxID=1813 RepID=UPI000481580A|nr:MULTISPECIES: TetR family transcriptional regulator C-terminal domain-containing protein [Amycolatopsis]MCF6427071.1 TetR family transcriptional regulator C-terminal domain-containing protein [Amycolatopsis tucumanensis]